MNFPCPSLLSIQSGPRFSHGHRCCMQEALEAIDDIRSLPPDAA